MFFEGGWKYVALVAVTASAVSFTGPGRWSLDHLLGLEPGRVGWGLAAACVGLAGGAATVARFRTPVTREEPT